MTRKSIFTAVGYLVFGAALAFGVLYRAATDFSLFAVVLYASFHGILWCILIVQAYRGDPMAYWLLPASLLYVSGYVIFMENIEVTTTSTAAKLTAITLLVLAAALSLAFGKNVSAQDDISSLVHTKRFSVALLDRLLCPFERCPWCKQLIIPKASKLTAGPAHPLFCDHCKKKVGISNTMVIGLIACFSAIVAAGKYYFMLSDNNMAILMYSSGLIMLFVGYAFVPLEPKL